MHIKDIRQLLTNLDSDFPDRQAFNEAVGKHFKLCGGGLFRNAYDTGSHVVKLRVTLREFLNANENHSVVDLERANRQERSIWLLMKRRYPSLLRFALEPMLWKGYFHDAVIMEKVDTVESIGIGVNAFDLFTPQMKRQYQFISTYFADTHEGNIGWSMARNRVYYIDLNMGWKSYTDGCIAEAQLVA
jgi:hypothetical protein